MSQNSSYRLSMQTTKVNVITNTVLTEDNIDEIRGVTATEQHPMLKLGDTLTVEFFHNAKQRCAGTVTIWHNKNYAAIKTYSTSFAGEWLDTLKLVVSEELEEGWTMDGVLVTGNLAIDINGTVGIYSCGDFYPNREAASLD